MNHYRDIDCSFKRLPAVYGYHTQQVVSLEKSSEQIHSWIAGLDDFIKVAKRRCHFSIWIWFSDESTSIYIYTMERGETELEPD